jgi:hypothetical protein
MNRLFIAALFTALLLPQLASARGPIFEAPSLSPTSNNAYEHAVLMNREALRDDLRALAEDIRELHQVARHMRSRRARRALQRRIDRMERHLRRARKALKNAPELRRARRRPRPPVVQQAAPPPMVRHAKATGKQMNALLLSMEGASFRDDKLRVIRQAADANWYSTEQVRALAEQLAFGDDRVSAIVTLYPKLVDPENVHSLYSVLPHSSDRDALEQRLSGL